MVEITKEQIEKIADAARLEINAEESDVLMKQLSDMFSSFDVLKELDTTDVKPTVHPHDLKNVMRKDEPRQWISQEEALKNSMDTKDSQFRVPSILE